MISTNKLLLLFSLIFNYTFAQTTQDATLKVNSYNPTSEKQRLLLKPNSYLRDNMVANEKVLDVVKVAVIDSIHKVVKQKPNYPGAWFASIFMHKYWLSYGWPKQKYIGTMARAFMVHDAVGKELDVNNFLAPHLPKYVNLILHGQKVLQDSKFDLQDFKQFNPPFKNEEILKSEAGNYFAIEGEITPPYEYFDELQEKFFPTKSEFEAPESHPNFGEPYPSMGIYGSYVQDCQHNCRPEIHPYEWVWWLNLNPNLKNESKKTWLVGLLCDWSKRFKQWAPCPRTGYIKIPFAVDKQRESSTLISIEHLVYGSFNEFDFSTHFSALDGKIINAADSLRKFEVTLDKDKTHSIMIKTSNLIHTNALKYKLTDLSYDQEKGILIGYLAIYASVNELYTARITIE